MASLPLFLLGVAILTTIALWAIVLLASGWLRRHRGIRAVGIGTLALLVTLTVGLVAYLARGGTSPSGNVLGTAAPVPTGSGLYSAAYGQVGGGEVPIERLDARTGTRQWQITVPTGRPLAQPLVAAGDGVLYAATGWDIWALNGSDGTQLWHTTLGLPGMGTPGAAPGLGVNAQPISGDGNIYLSLAGGYQSGQLVALRASDGKQLWNRAFDAAPSVAAGDGLVVASVDDVISALHATDGSPAWQAPYKGGVQLLGGLIYVDESPAPLLALDEHTGALVWTLPCWKESAIVPSASGVQIFIGCLEPHSPEATGEGIFAFDTQQRQLLWKYHAFDVNIAAPVVASDLVIIPHGTTLDAVRASDGKRVWTQEAELPNAGPVALAAIGDTVYVRVRMIYPHVIIYGCGTNCKQSYSLSALRASDGAIYWRHYEPQDEVPWLEPAP
jgi:outer membrane protein assembly factor BamB